MPDDLTMLLFEVNQLICRLVRGDIDASEELRRKADALPDLAAFVRLPFLDTQGAPPRRPAQ